MVNAVEDELATVSGCATARQGRLLISQMAR